MCSAPIQQYAEMREIIANQTKLYMHVMLAETLHL